MTPLSHRIGRTLLMGAQFLVVSALAASSVRAAELIGPKTTERLFPRFVFCPLPFDVAFLTDGPDITLRISTDTVNYFDTNLNEITWSHQQIDDICVMSDEDFQAHQGPYSGDCYFGNGEQFPVGNVFRLQDAGTIPLKELFAADGQDPAQTGWDVTHGCSWNTSSTAPNDPGTGSNFTPKGCLDLGQFSATPVLGDSAYTTRTVTGLTPNHVYHLTGWWNVNTSTFELNQIALTVRIFGSTNPTPTIVRSWGGLKQLYR